MRVRDVAARLEVSQATVYALIGSGKLRCHRIGVGRGCIRVDEDQLAEYLRGSVPGAVPVTVPARHVRFRHLKSS